MDLPPASPASVEPSSLPVAFPPSSAVGQAVPAERLLTSDDLGRRQRSRVMPLLLFLATCFFTYAAGAYHWDGLVFGTDPTNSWNPQYAIDLLVKNWRNGLIYMGSVMTVLVFHEMGHFLMTVRYHVPASFPIFLPLPFMFTGTMGAVIGMEGSRANRRQLFDIGLAGPLAGLVPTVALVWIGIKTADPSPGMHLGQPLLAKLLTQWIRPDLPPGVELLNPIYMAGWVGMFITGLNMMPVSQLDGGHTIYALFLERSHVIARAFLLGAMAFVVIDGQFQWTLMLVLVTLLGVDHPPTSDDHVRLGPVRTVVGLLSLAIPIFCFTPYLLPQ
ncbi:MAG: site-2 protease family protein [Pirellulales bacterium]|nr:site-2 protease family protein [Pirellulales bacterium]